MSTRRATNLVVVLSFAATVASAQVSEVQRAAERGDAAAFRSALGRLRENPSAARQVLPVYEDLDRLWRHQLESPEGAFFEESSGLVSMLSQYHGYKSFIAGRTVRGSGTTFYPTRESREFLVREAARRIAQRGKEPAGERDVAREPAAAKSAPQETTAVKPKPAGREARAEGVLPVLPLPVRSTLPAPAAAGAEAPPLRAAGPDSPRVTMTVESAAVVPGPAGTSALPPSSSAGPVPGDTTVAATLPAPASPVPSPASDSEPAVTSADLPEENTAAPAPAETSSRSMRNIGVSVFLIIAGIALFVALTRAAA